MNLNLNFEQLKDKAIDVAQTAARKTKDLASMAKARITIAAEEEKIRKAQYINQPKSIKRGALNPASAPLSAFSLF